MEYLKTLGTALTTAVVVSLILGYLARTFIENWLKRRFKESDDKTAKEFAQFQAALNAFNARNETQYNYHFNSRAEAIKEISKRANEVLALVSNVLYRKSIPLDNRTLESNIEFELRAK